MVSSFLQWLSKKYRVGRQNRPVQKERRHVARPELLYWFAILMAINLQTSFLTPSFGFALFYLKGSAPTDLPMQTIWRRAAPFVVLQLIALALVAAFPDIALWLPRTYLN
jgi:TRAP-type mannitol/chloroaromatic compound transport system permease large subunit